MDPKDYSTKNISNRLIDDITSELKNLQYGSVELYVTDGQVTQISRRQITKTQKNNNTKNRQY